VEWSLGKVVVVVDFGLILKWSSISIRGWSANLGLGVDLVVFVSFGWGVWIWWIEEGGDVACGSPEERNEEEKRNEEREKKVKIK
jgi:hypothetical protein